MKPPRVVLLLALCVSLSVSPLAGAGGGFPTKLTLDRALPRRGVDLEHLKARDKLRHGRLLQSSSYSPTMAPGVVDFPVEGSANPFTVGLYFTRVSLGNPAKEFYVQIDTGSDVLWVTCTPCSGCPTSSGLNIQLDFYDPTQSSTASTISCSDDLCTSGVQYGDAVCTTSDSQSSACSYSFQYGDGSSTSGYYVSDTLYFDTVTGNGQTANSSATIAFGCSTSQSGDLTQSDRAISGIFGFGQNGLSVIAQLSSKGVAPMVFSHCLIGTGNGGGILVLGEIVEPGIVYTPLVQSQPHYNLNLESIAVNGQTLSVDSSVFATSNTQGTIVDSGTTLAYLVEQAYQPFVNAIVASASSSVQQFVSKGSQCFVTSGSIDDLFPSVALNFEGSVSMTLNPEDYLLEQGSTGGSNIWCIGWQSNQGQTILGDLVLQNKIVVYDIANQRLGWVNYDCSLPVNVSTSLGKNAYLNAGQMAVSGSSHTVFADLLPTGIAVLLVYNFVLAILHR